MTETQITQRDHLLRTQEQLISNAEYALECAEELLGEDGGPLLAMFKNQVSTLRATTHVLQNRIQVAVIKEYQHAQSAPDPDRNSRDRWLREQFGSNAS